MKSRKPRLMLSLSLLTAVTLVGSLELSFLTDKSGLGNLIRNHPSILQNPIESVSLIAPLFLGGALWGVSTTRLKKSNSYVLVWRGALVWGITMILMAYLVHSTPFVINLYRLPQTFPFHVHGFFTLVFVLAVGIIAGINSGAIVHPLGFTGVPWAVARNSGSAAALGFLVISLVSLATGWEVTPYTGITMFWVMRAGLIAAAMAGGAAMGWTLATRCNKSINPVSTNSTIS